MSFRRSPTVALAGRSSTNCDLPIKRDNPDPSRTCTSIGSFRDRGSELPAPRSFLLHGGCRRHSEGAPRREARAPLRIKAICLPNTPRTGDHRGAGGGASINATLSTEYQLVRTRGCSGIRAPAFDITLPASRKRSHRRQPCDTEILRSPAVGCHCGFPIDKLA